MTCKDKASYGSSPPYSAILEKMGKYTRYEAFCGSAFCKSQKWLNCPSSKSNAILQKSSRWLVIGTAMIFKIDKIWGLLGWRRHIGSPKLQIIVHKRAIKYRSLLREMTYKDKGSYESSPPCMRLVAVVSFESPILEYCDWSRQCMMIDAYDSFCVAVCAAVCCSVLQCVAVCCSQNCTEWVIYLLAFTVLCCTVLHCAAVCCSVLQCVLRNVAVCCSVLQCVAVCCSVLQRVAGRCRHSYKYSQTHTYTNTQTQTPTRKKIHRKINK